MNARYAELIAGDAGPDSWAQAGDQLYVDLDLSEENLPAGSRLAVGSGHHRDRGRAAHRVRRLQRALRLGGAAAGQLGARPPPAAARRQHGRGPSGIVRIGDVARKL